MKTLVSTERAGYVSETLSFNGMKFKVVSSNGNCYSHLEIFVYTRNYDLSKIACECDIPDYAGINYVWDDDKRLRYGRNNITAAKKYIKKVYSDLKID